MLELIVHHDGTRWLAFFADGKAVPCGTGPTVEGAMAALLIASQKKLGYRLSVSVNNNFVEVPPDMLTAFQRWARCVDLIEELVELAPHAEKIGPITLPPSGCPLTMDTELVEIPPLEKTAGPADAAQPAEPA